jgi:hypothetical protein
MQLPNCGQGSISRRWRWLGEENAREVTETLDKMLERRSQFHGGGRPKADADNRTGTSPSLSDVRLRHYPNRFRCCHCPRMVPSVTKDDIVLEIPAVYSVTSWSRTY